MATMVLPLPHGRELDLATRLAREDRRDLALVAEILRHADLKTTRPYVHSGLEDRRAALEDLAE